MDAEVSLLKRKALHVAEVLQMALRESRSAPFARRRHARPSAPGRARCRAALVGAAAVAGGVLWGLRRR